MESGINSNLVNFSREQLKSWDDSDGVNFAIALARVTGWLIHVNWWNPKPGIDDEKKMKSLRVYVQDDKATRVFDLFGVLPLKQFVSLIIMPLLRQRIDANVKGPGEIVTRFYSEEKVFTLPLRVKPSEERIIKAENAIRNNTDFLKQIPIRKKPFVPAHIAGNFTFGHCVIFAQAMHELTDKKVIGIIAHKYNKQFEFSKLGYAHSVILNPDGSFEDVWGVEDINVIAERFGIVKYTLEDNGNEHTKRVNSLKKNSPEKYKEIYQEAVDIISKFF